MQEFAEETIEKHKILRRLRQVLKPQVGSIDSDEMGDFEGDETDKSFPVDAEDLAWSIAANDIYNVPLSSARKLGFVIIAVKSLLRKLLRPSLEQQVIYNRANTRIVRGLVRSQQTLKEDVQAEIDNRLEELMNRLEVQSQEIEMLKAEIARLKAVTRDETLSK